VQGLLARGLAPELPIMRAVGVPQLVEHLAGRASLIDAIEAAKLATRHYIKRQGTWIRRNMNAWKNANL
jgi:tRNA dimethylallyltransferase